MKSFLVINIGSSSIKYALYDAENLDCLSKEKIDCPSDKSEEKLQILISSLTVKPIAVAHRIVHGGTRYIKTTKLNDDILKDLETLSPYAPLHQPHNINGVRILKKLLPNCPHYGCFDTAFHAEQLPLHTSFALPLALRKQGIRRFGFHGLSYEWIARQFPPQRLVIAHLGSGASLCAVKNCKSIETTMGLTALDGLPMATRCGNLDAGAVLSLLSHHGYSAERLERVLYTESGLKGLSNLSGDVRTLLAERDTQPDAQFALDYFSLKVAQGIASLSIALGGIDTLVFTGGIGENAPTLREAILAQLKPVLPSFSVEVIPANEERMMATLLAEELSHA